MTGCFTVRRFLPGSPEYEQSLLLRDEILRRPIGLSLKDEDLSDEARQLHFGIFDDQRMLRVLLLDPQDEQTVKMRQMAVRSELQGSGLGKQLVRFAEGAAKEHGYSKITLHARKTAVPFYERLGYSVTGDEFLEVGIPHLSMEKQL